MSEPKWAVGDQFQVALRKDLGPQPSAQIHTVREWTDGYRDIITVEDGKRFYADHCHKVLVAPEAIDAALTGLQEIKKELTRVTWEYRIWANTCDGTADSNDNIWAWEARASDDTWTAQGGGQLMLPVAQRRARLECEEQRRIHLEAVAHDEAEWIEYEP